MVRIVKHQTEDGNFDFEFVGFDCWDDFDTLSNILLNQMDSSVTDKLEGIYSRYWTFEKDDKKFKLMYHEDTGNCLCQFSKDDNNCKFIEELANKMLPFINSSLCGN